MIEKRVSNVGILYIRLHHPHLDWSVCKFQACDRYRKSRYSPHTSDTQYMPTFDTLSLSYTLGISYHIDVLTLEREASGVSASPEFWQCHAPFLSPRQEALKQGWLSAEELLVWGHFLPPTLVFALLLLPLLLY